MFSEPAKATVPVPSTLENAGPIHRGACGLSATARFMSTSPGFTLIRQDVSSSLECRPGVSSGGFSRTPRRTLSSRSVGVL